MNTKLSNLSNKTLKNILLMFSYRKLKNISMKYGISDKAKIDIVNSIVENRKNNFNLLQDLILEG